MDYNQKLDQYKNGQYRFKAPPVCTARWDDDAWIKWIDACNGWDNILPPCPVCMATIKFNPKGEKIFTCGCNKDLPSFLGGDE